MSVHVAGVNLPGRLIDAHRDGRLVLFVGAGASMAPPTCLPNFVDLVKRIASATEQKCPEFVRQAPDRALGLLDAKAGVDVHQLIRDEINQSRKPSEVHEQLSRLALSAPQPRIVTTNYDRHLSDCLARRSSIGTDLEEFSAPALPQGDDFTGIVYLHGSASGPAKRLVATDTDFSDAYIRRRWASDFLLQMFEAFTVLFVGYSMDDVLMRYLSLGPLSSSNRFALVSTEKPELTSRSGISQIVYGDYGHLPDLLSEWNDEIGLSLHDHRTRVRDIVQGDPPLDETASAYMRETFARPERRRFFTRFARRPGWLLWAVEQGTFFSVCEESDEVSQADAWDLSWWFAHAYAVRCDGANGPDEINRSELAFRLILAAENGIGPTLRRALVFAIRDAKNAHKSELLRRWLPILLDGAMPYEADDIGMLLRECRLPQDRRAAVHLIEFLTTPRLSRPGGSSFYPAAHLELKIDGHLSEYHWEEVVRPLLTQLAVDLGPVFEHQLRTVSRLARFDPRVTDDLDWFSVSRVAIRHSQFDRALAGEASGLIDLACEVLEELVATGPPANAMSLLHCWEHADEAILRRLAVHGWAKRSDIGSDEKLEWLIGSGLLADDAFHRETRHLIETTVSDASSSVVNRLINHISQGAGL